MESINKLLKNYIQVVILFLGVVLAAGIIVYLSYSKISKPFNSDNTFHPVADHMIEPSLVSMTHDAYMGSVQIPFEVDHKIYYGCCAGCLETLKNNPGSRYSTDPYSGEKIDKSGAYIALNPKGDGTVLYFNSLKNLNQFFKEKNSDYEP